VGGEWSKTSTPILPFPHHKGEGSEIRNVIEYFLAQLGLKFSSRRSNKLLKKSFSAGWSKMPRCKAPEILRNEAL